MQKNDIIASIKSLDDRVFLFNSNHALIKASVDVRRGIKLRFFFFFFCSAPIYGLTITMIDPHQADATKRRLWRKSGNFCGKRDVAR